jgi:hypothetical protein
MMKPALILIALALPLVALGDWDGHPWDTTDAATWYQMKDTWDILNQWHSGIVERCTMTGFVNPPQIIQSFYCDAGVSQSVHTVNGITYTNERVIQIRVARTNQFEPFSYSWNLPHGSGTAIACPRLEEEVIAELTDKQEDLYLYFVNTNAADPDGSFDSFLTGGGYTSDAWPPVHSKITVHREADVGRWVASSTGLANIVYGTAHYDFYEGDAPGTEIVLAEAVADLAFHATGFDWNIAGGSNPDYEVDGTYIWHDGYTHGFTRTDGDYDDGWPEEWSPRPTFWKSRRYNQWGFDQHIWAGNVRFPNHKPDIYSPIGAGPTGTEWTLGASKGDFTNAAVTMTTNWNFRHQEDLRSTWDSDRTHYYTNKAPVIRYVRGDATADLESLTVTIQGEYIDTESGLEKTVNSRTDGEEVVSVSAAITPAALAWYSVTNMIVTGPLDRGDHLSVVWTNLTLQGDVPSRIWNRTIRQRIDCLRQLAWVWKSGRWYRPAASGLPDCDPWPTGSSSYRWNGIQWQIPDENGGTNEWQGGHFGGNWPFHSWAASKDETCNDWDKSPFPQAGISRGCLSRTVGMLSVGEGENHYWSTANTVRQEILFTNMTDDLEVDIDVYGMGYLSMASPHFDPGVKTFESPDGWTWQDEVPCRVYTEAGHTGVGWVSPVFGGDTTCPPSEWCDAPTVDGTMNVRGFQTYPRLWGVVKYDPEY